MMNEAQCRLTISVLENRLKTPHLVPEIRTMVQSDLDRANTELQQILNTQEAAECLELCQSLFGDEWRVMIRAMPVLIAWYTGELQDDEAPKFLVPIVGDITKFELRAIVAGVKLARGEE